MVWKPSKTVGLVAGIVIGAMLALALAAILVSLRHQITDIGAVLTVVMFGLTILAMVRWVLNLYALISLRYSLDRNALIIHCGVFEHTIPLGAITDIVPGSEMALPETQVTPLWPGYHSGRVVWDPTRPTWLHGTAPLSQQLVVMTDSALYAISPAQPERFVEDYVTRKSMGPVRDIRQATTPVGIAAWSVWRDRPYWGVMILAALANLALYGLYVARLDLSGPVGPWNLRQLMTPGLGSLILLSNIALSIFLYRFERLATWLLLVVAILAQIVLASAALPTWVSR